ncbi:MAG: hypothetical protein V3V16_11990 [Melioribacteraceae bacterium]
MLKRIIMIFSLSIIGFSILSAQEETQTKIDYSKSGGFARLKSMGNNPFVLDPTNVMVNPALGSIYNNILFGDLGTTIASNFEAGGIGQFFAANFNINENLTVGATLSRKDFNGSLSISNLDPFGLVRETNNALSSLGLIELDNNWAFMSSYSLGNHSFGFGVSYASSSAESKPATSGGTEGNASQLGLNIGYFGKINSRLSLEISGVLLSPSTSFQRPQSSETKFSQSVISISGRAFYKTNSKFTLIPFGQVFKTSGSGDLGDADGITKTDLPSNLAVQFGLGVSYKSGDFLFVGGPSFGYLQEKTPAVAGVAPVLTKTTSSFPVWNVGAEWEMIKWLTARLGYSGRTSTVSTETVASPTNTNENITTTFDPINGGITLGVGFKFTGFYLDATVNEDILRQGLNNLGGGGATFAYVSAGYIF